MNNLNIIILAAGNSTRLHSSLTKVLHPIAGQPMLGHILEKIEALSPSQMVLVVGNHSEKVKEFTQKTLSNFKGKLRWAHQETRLGTGHAARLGFEQLERPSGKVLILNGDAPLLHLNTLEKLIELSQNASLTFLTAVVEKPHGYGRVLRDSSQKVIEVIEERNTNPEQKSIREINAGAYMVDASFLKAALPQIQPNTLTQEYYLPDLIPLALRQGYAVEAFCTEDAEEILGANTREELAELNRLKRWQIAQKHMAQGVGMNDPRHVFIDSQVVLAPDAFLGFGVHLLGKTQVGKNTEIEAGCILKNCIVEDGVQIKAYSYLEDCVVRTQSVIGPFARIRPDSEIGPQAKVGNFVELKKTKLGTGSKANHLSYLGDAVIGDNVNIGAGTITCNYDGHSKFVTTIDEGVFIGSDVQLVAPVHVHPQAYVAAGTTVTQDVPEGSLAISRTKQENILGYSQKQKKKLSK